MEAGGRRVLENYYGGLYVIETALEIGSLYLSPIGTVLALHDGRCSEQRRDIQGR
jgi:hypothetical protein